MSDLKACKVCRYLVAEDTCPVCGGEMSKEWQGYLIIMEHAKSEIAKKSGINVDGKYALKVR